MKKILLLALAVFGFAFICNSVASAQMKTVVAVTGSVFNEITKDPIKIPYEVLSMDGKRISKGKTNPAQNGYYYVTGLKPGEKYIIRFDDPGYFKQDFVIDIPNTEKYAEFSHDYLVKPKYAGMEVKANVPPFEVNKSKVRAGAELFLEDILSTLKNNPTLKFNIVCYPDNDNNAQLNIKLTESRANSMKEFFTKNGIDAARLSFDSKPSTDPKNPPPAEKRAKGKRYIGSIYFIVKEV